MKVVEWVAWEEARKLSTGMPILGGSFKEGQRWKDYLEYFLEAYHPHMEAIRAEVLRLGLKEGGDWHQDSEAGAPVFDDGTAETFSYRAWGDLLAAIWAEAEQRDYHYMDFYMSCNVRDRKVVGP